jgi:hypothetical protein
MGRRPGSSWPSYRRRTGSAYFANDLVQQQTSGTQRQAWTLDSGLRFRSWTTESNLSNLHSDVTLALPVHAGHAAT